MLRAPLLAALTLLATGLVVTAANAHPRLTGTAPTAGGSTISPPNEIRLTFSEGVIAKFSGIELMDQSGKKIKMGETATDPNDQKQLVVPLPAPLNAGVYQVDWHAVSVDTHRVKGSYSFTVGR